MGRAEYSGWFERNIYPMATSFANKNPIDGYEREDYVQDLVAKAWEKLESYDPSKSTLSTFVYLWFRSERIRILDKVIHSSKLFDYRDVEDADGNVCNVCSLAESDDDIAAEYSESEEFSMLTPISAAFFDGASLREVSRAFGLCRMDVLEHIKSDVDALRDVMEVYIQ